MIAKASRLRYGFSQRNSRLLLADYSELYRHLQRTVLPMCLFPRLAHIRMVMSGVYCFWLKLEITSSPTEVTVVVNTEIFVLDKKFPVNSVSDSMQGIIDNIAKASHT